MRALSALLVSTCLASAQDAGPSYYNDGWERPLGHDGPIVSRHGIGHSTWHETFYATLKRDDGTPCCSFNDCRPTLSRMIGNHYEILVDEKWVVVPPSTIKRVIAPDHGAHVCAPMMDDYNTTPIYCVVLPPEG